MPTWSPDGKVIAWCGKLYDGSYKIYYAYLRKEDADKSEDDWSHNEDHPKNLPIDIDFDGLAERVVEINHVGSSPHNLFWSWDSKALGFISTIKDQAATRKIFFPGSKKPELLSKSTGNQPKWTAKGLFWLKDQLPAKLDEKYELQCYQEIDLVEYRKLTFRSIWRGLKVNFYDAKLNNRDWHKILTKYEEMAGYCSDTPSFSRLVNMLHGELNASHLGWIPNKNSASFSSGNWKKITHHCGLFFEKNSLIVKRVLPGSPADKAQSHVHIGEQILSVDGYAIANQAEFMRRMTLRPGQKVRLELLSPENSKRFIELKGIDYDSFWELQRKDEISRPPQKRR